ncbi:MAG: HEAT repeat domain-containing protein, partial [Cyanobacteriota bacterium]
MSSRICLALSLLTILTFLADETPAAAQRETFSLPPALPARPGDRETAKPIVVAELVEQLRTADVEERRKIIRQLSDTEQNIVPALVRAMDDPDPLVKSGVAEVLGNLTDAAVPAIPELIEMMNDERRAIVPQSRFVAPYPYAIRPLSSLSS